MTNHIVSTTETEHVTCLLRVTLTRVSLYGVIRELWKTRWIRHVFRRDSLVLVDVEWSTLNGLWRLAASFTLGCGAYVGTIQPDKITFLECVWWSIWFHSFHDFCCNLKGCCDFILNLVHGAKSVFHCGDGGGEVYWRYEFRSLFIPYLEWRVSCSAVYPGIMSKFYKRNQTSPIINLIVTKHSKVLF